ncbi:MAG: phosphoserine phosphatase SerB [Hyphomicrobiaceae bacterium]|nr:phosphoserine phosphatase SerB [Hyphomicrobiaceae bacterium]
MSDAKACLLVLTAAPGENRLGESHVAAAVAALGGDAIAEARWLSPGEAWEAHVQAGAALPLPTLKARIAAALGPAPVDVNVLALGGADRRKKLLVADMESTIIVQECLDELAEYAGIRPRIAAITERAMRGELDFEAALKERVGLLAGLDAGVLQEIYDRRVSLMPGAAVLVATLKAHGAYCALVSGGFSFYTERIAARLGFDTQQANTLEIAGGKLTGTVAAPILGREAKLDALQRLARQLGIAAADALATGDGANDLAMIKAAGLGVAFRAKPIVAAEAQASVRHGDLTALLYLQGYHADEFVRA